MSCIRFSRTYVYLNYAEIQKKYSPLLLYVLAQALRIRNCVIIQRHKPKA